MFFGGVFSGVWNFNCQRFGALCLFHLHRQVGTKSLHTDSPMKMEQTECSETLEFKLQTLGNNTQENIRHSKHSESLKSNKINSHY
jgi:hypothetical protein